MQNTAVGIFNPAVLFARHGMSGEKPPRRLTAEHRPDTVDDCFFRPADVRDQRVRRDDRANALNQINNSANRRGKKNQVAALDCRDRIFNRRVYGAHLQCAIQHGGSVTSDDAPFESRGLDRQRK